MTKTEGVIIDKVVYILAVLFFICFFYHFSSPTETLIFRDHTNYFLPTKHFLAESESFWMPHNYLGIPAYADPQIGFWYPGSLIFKMVPLVRAYNLYIVMHFGVIYVFSYLIGHQLFDRLSGLFLAVGCTYAGVTLSLSEFSSYFVSFAYFFPGFYLLVDFTRKKSRSRLFLLPVLAFLSLTAGGLLFFVINSMVMIFGLGFFVLRREIDWKLAVQLVLFGIVVCYLPVFYYFELYLNSPLTHGYEMVGELKFNQSGLIRLFDYRANGWEQFLTAPDTLYPFAYCGLVGLLLFLLGLRHYKKTAMLGAVFLLAASGGIVWRVGTIVFALGQFRYPEKLVAYAVPAFFLCAAGGLFRLRVKKKIKLLIVVIFFAELFLINAGYFVFVPFFDGLQKKEPFSIPPGTRVISIVDKGFGPNFPATSLEEYNSEQLKYKFGLAAKFYDLQSFLGYSPAKLENYYRLKEFFSFGGLNARQRTRLLQNCGVEYVVGKIRIDDSAVLNRQEFWEPVHTDMAENFQVFRITDAKPRAYLIAVSEITATKHLADIIRPLPNLEPLRVEKKEDGITAACELLVPRYLVFNSFYYPGMEITIDGNVVEHELVFTIFPAVYVSAGVHQIEFKYRPTGFVINLILWACGTGLWGWGWWRCRQAD